MSEKEEQNNKKKSHFFNEIKNRRKKLEFLRKKSTSPFPNDFRRNYTLHQLHSEFGIKKKEELKVLKIEVSIAGRMIARRIMGKASFVTLQDINGSIQLYVSINNLSNIYNQFKMWDLGDILGAKGKLFKTKTGELSIYCTEIRLLTKSIRPLPNKFFGLKDQETRYRKRYLDLISNSKSRNIFLIRSKILTGIRNFMINRNFLEVETPMMQIIPGGASARPFVTYHNSLNTIMYLRVAPELYLKRLIVGGFDRIFEINKSFRNEGISTHHNPEFTMMELYMAYANYQDLIEIIESMFRILSKEIFGITKVSYGNKKFEFDKPFEKLTMKEAIKKYCPNIKITDLNDLNAAKFVAKHHADIKIEETWGLGRIITEIFEKLVKENLFHPTFITEYPTEVSPLARKNDSNPEISDRFEIFIGGKEIGNGFSELNDPEEQKRRFHNQIAFLKKNYLSDDDKKNFFYDEDYIIALEHGLPPTAGLGIGIDRVVMLFTDSHTIRDVILFPAMRLENE